MHRVRDCIGSVDWEMIFVDDDSPDGTADAVRMAAQVDHRVRVIHRIGRRGLASACVEGILSSSAPFVAIMDADLQHDETLLPRMLEECRRADLDIVIGSRYAPGGGIGEWGRGRAWLSRIATRMGKALLKTDLSDPMSGFFLMRRDAAVIAIRHGGNGIGYKILLHFLASTPGKLRSGEMPYQFRNRRAGESKLDSMVVWEYFLLLLHNFVGRVVPVRFIAFSLVGGIGVLVHLAELTALDRGVATPVVESQAVATIAAMTFNFWLNNMLTYRDMRLRGWGWLRGWLSFLLVCSVGAIANVGIASYLFGTKTFWVISAVAGIMVGAVWNYAVTALFTWRKARGD